jgi:uncharacterized protein (DUF433 family)
VLHSTAQLCNFYITGRPLLRGGLARAALAETTTRPDHWLSQFRPLRTRLRGLRVTVGTIVGSVVAARTTTDILALSPCLEVDDIREALAYAAWRAKEVDIPPGDERFSA